MKASSVSLASPPAGHPVSSHQRPVRIGTRGSALALAQADLVGHLVTALGHATERVIIRTQGDADRISPLSQIGGQGVFTSALQDALLRDEIDVAVHSAKDLPSAEAEGLTLAAFLSRQDPRDVLISKSGAGLANLPAGATVGTSSRRRIAQLRSARADIAIVDLRGNIDSRIRRATEGDLDAVILAAAGLHRLGWEDRITEYLSLDRFVPAPSQAALAIEIRADDAAVAGIVAGLDEPAVSRCVRIERAFLRILGAGCTMPVAAHADLIDGRVRLRAMIAAEDLTAARWATVTLDTGEEERHAAEVALDLTEPDVSDDWVAPSGVPVGATVTPAILVTRPVDQAEGLADALRAAGYEPVIAPMLRVGPGDGPAIEKALERLRDGRFDWVVFSSANAVNALAERDAELSRRLTGASSGERVRVAAVGPRTAARLREIGITPDLVADQSDAAGLVASMTTERMEGRRVWLPQGNLARPDLAEGLAGLGAEVETTVVYSVTPPDTIDEDVRRRLVGGGIAALTFASPSAADHLLDLLRADRGRLADIPAVCIGQTTATRVRELGLTVAAVATEASDAGMIAALETLFPDHVVSAETERASDPHPRVPATNGEAR